MIEDELIQDSDNVIILNDPIAISRIDKIYIKDIDLVDRLISNMTMATNTAGGVAVVNKELFEKLDIEQNLSVMPNLSPSPVDEDKLRTKLDKFNRIMGAMAFISHKQNDNLNKTLFDILSILNKDIATEYKKVTNFEPNLQTIPIKELDLSSYEILNFKDCKNKLDEKHIKTEIADKFEVSMDKFKLNEIDTGLKILYNLFKASDPISSEEIKKMDNDALFLYGYNKRYDRLRSHYEKKVVKFNIDRFIDRAIIEIIYQYAIKDKDNVDIFFLDNYKQNSTSRMEDYKDYYLFDSSKPFSINDFIDEYKTGNFYQNNEFLKEYIEADNELTTNLDKLYTEKNQKKQDLDNRFEESKKREEAINQTKKENIILRQKLKNNNPSDNIGNNSNNNESANEKINSIKNQLKDINSKSKKDDYKKVIDEIDKIINRDESLF